MNEQPRQKTTNLVAGVPLDDLIAYSFAVVRLATAIWIGIGYPSVPNLGIALLLIWSTKRP